jgi:outer membrane lipase/esterase
MGKELRIFTIATSLVLGTISATAQAPHYTNLYVFGDSYCDVGNLYAAFGHPGPPYYDGRFSNGPIWVDHVAGFLGLPLTPSLLGGTDYAFGQAFVTRPEGTIPSVPQQVEHYLSDNGGKADPNALYILEGGINDIVSTNFDNPEEIGFQIALGLATSEQQLRRAGARHFLVSNLFDVGLLPAAAYKSSLASAATTATNKWLNTLFSKERRVDGIDIFRLNLFSLVNAIGKDPTHFGFTNVTDPCVTTSICVNPDHWFFFDSVHVTEVAHSDFAVAVESVLANRDRD